MKRLWRALAVVLVVLGAAAGCAAPTPTAAPNPDAPLLAGTWQQFVPIESMPREISLDASGSGAADQDGVRWRLADGDLYIRRGGQETRYSYTVSGYMLTLHDVSSDTSEFYINPNAFAVGADKNADLKGRWAAWSTFSMMEFDGGADLTTIVYTTAGRSDLPAKYAARDGILQTVDTSGNYTYNLYSFGSDGSLLLAETTEYDNENRQSTAYWKTAAPPADLLGNWKQAVATEPGNEGLPEALNLDEANKGSAAAAGSNPSSIKWDYYAGGFIVIEYSETHLQYAWSTPQDGTLFLGNPDVDEAWYIDQGRFKPDVKPLDKLAGIWKPEGEDKPSLEILAGGSVKIMSGAGQAATLSAAAAGGVLELKQGSKTYFMAYSEDSGTMQLYYHGLPFLEDRELPVTLVKS